MALELGQGGYSLSIGASTGSERTRSVYAATLLGAGCSSTTGVVALELGMGGAAYAKYIGSTPDERIGSGYAQPCRAVSLIGGKSNTLSVCF